MCARTSPALGNVQRRVSATMRMCPNEFPPNRRGDPKRRAEFRVFGALAGIKRQGFVRYEWRSQPGEGTRPVKSCQWNVAWLLMVSRRHDETLVSSRKVSDVSLVVRRSSGRMSFGSSGCRFGQSRDPTIRRLSSPMRTPNVGKPFWLRTPVSADGGSGLLPIHCRSQPPRPSCAPHVRDPTTT